MAWWGVFFSSAPIARTKPCVDSDHSSNALDAGNIPLAPPQHQPAAVQEVRRLWSPLLAVDPHVVDVGAALTDRAPCCALASRQTARHQQVGDSAGSARLELCHRCRSEE